MTRSFRASCWLVLPFFLLISAPLGAQEPDLGLLPPAGAFEEINAPDLRHETHPPIRMTPDRTELIRLDAEAGSVVVGNPAHISVLMDSPDLLVVVPKAVGATHFTVLDQDGKILMQRHAIVASPQSRYIRLRSTCLGIPTNEDCFQTVSYFCPDICHEISPVLPESKEAAEEESQDDSGTPSQAYPGVMDETN